MKICLLHSLDEGINSLCNKYSDIPDPRLYIPESFHQFSLRHVSKAKAKQDIDLICREGKKEGWEFYMNFMWGNSHDNVAGFEATKYLESKGVPILTNPSKFLKKTKVDFYHAATTYGLRIPLDTKGVYPKIVKYGNAYGSLNLDNDSICASAKAVNERVFYMKRCCRQFKVLVQDYIAGREVSVTVIDTGGKQFATTPVECIFPTNLKPNERFITWEMKFDERDNKNTLKYALLKEEPAQSQLKKAAIDAFNALHLLGNAGWARINMRLESSTGKVYVIETNSIPNIFYPFQKVPSDDLAIRDSFPGGHIALFDMLIMTKKNQMRSLCPRYKQLATVFNNYADTYQAWLHEPDLNYFKLMSLFIYRYDFTGTVFDVACGTGHFGKLLHNHGIKAIVKGLDISKKMLQSKAIRDHYEGPVLLGPMEELVMDISMQDHIVCFGCLHFLDRVSFNAVLAKIFMLARQSVTFEVDDLDDVHLNENTSLNSGLRLGSNHTESIKQFGVPKGWNRVCEIEYPMYTSTATGHEVSGIWYRFEK